MAIPWEKAGIFFALAQTTMRPSEARALRVKDWNGGDELRVYRAAKDRKARGVVRGLKARNAKVVPCPEFLLGFWLWEFVPSERRLSDPDGPLFRNPDGRSGGWWAEKTMGRTWAAACDAAGVPRVKLYEGTKHSTATRLKGLGADDRVLAQLMGHRDIRSVEKYAKLSPQTVAKILSRLESAKRES
jgi:integrase